MSDINKIMEAYLGMVSSRAELDESSCGTGKKSYKEGQEECPKCEGKGCDHCDDKGYHDVAEKKLDPVDDAENDKKFKDRKDKDIDNDGDVDSSDEYLHKKRKATDDAIDGGKKPANEYAKKPTKESKQVDELSTHLIRRAAAAADAKVDRAVGRADKTFDIKKKKGQSTSDIMKSKGFRKHADYANKKDRQAQKFKDRDASDKSATDAYRRYRDKGGKMGKDQFFAKYKAGYSVSFQNQNGRAVGGTDRHEPGDTYRGKENWYKRESVEVDLSQSFLEMWSAIEEALDPKKGATAPEKYDDHSSDHDKKVIAQHKKSDKKVEDQEEKSHDTVFKAAGKDMKQAPARSGADNLSNGDKTIVNPVKGK